MNKKHIIILGCTGSIGQSATTIMRHHRDLFTVVGLSAHTNEEELIELAEEFDVKSVSLSGRHPESERVSYSGKEGLLQMIRETDADVVINGISGAEGLMPSVASLESDKNLALANKETIVIAGSLVKKLARKHGKTIIPVDSEHSAIFSLLRKVEPEFIEEVVLTASGGAFRDTPAEELKYVTVKDALIHPTWSMGKKITIDSATMANKGLEIIETRELFDIPVENIHVVLHPQSCVHSLIRTRDGSLYAQISKPNMSIPIQNALTYPDLSSCMFGRLNLVDCTFTFHGVDEKKYPLIKTAYLTAEKGNAYPLAFNAANEIAVYAFMHGKIEYLDIPRVVTATLDADWSQPLLSFDQILYLDTEARHAAEQIVEKVVV